MFCCTSIPKLLDEPDCWIVSSNQSSIYRFTIYLGVFTKIYYISLYFTRSGAGFISRDNTPLFGYDRHDVFARGSQDGLHRAPCEYLNPTGFLHHMVLQYRNYSAWTAKRTSPVMDLWRLARGTPVPIPALRLPIDRSIGAIEFTTCNKIFLLSFT